MTKKITPLMIAAGLALAAGAQAQPNPDVEECKRRCEQKAPNPVPKPSPKKKNCTQLFDGKGQCMQHSVAKDHEFSEFVTGYCWGSQNYVCYNTGVKVPQEEPKPTEVTVNNNTFNVSPTIVNQTVVVPQSQRKDPQEPGQEDVEERVKGMIAGGFQGTYDTQDEVFYPGATLTGNYVFDIGLILGATLSFSGLGRTEDESRDPVPIGDRGDALYTKGSHDYTRYNFGVAGDVGWMVAPDVLGTILSLGYQHSWGEESQFRHEEVRDATGSVVQTREHDDMIAPFASEKRHYFTLDGKIPINVYEGLTIMPQGGLRVRIDEEGVDPMFGLSIGYSISDEKD